MTESDVRAFIRMNRWIFAKTMSETPHEYTLRKEAHDELLFDAFVLHIRRVGQAREFLGRTYMYLDVDGYEYWTMGAPLSQTRLINRAVKGRNQ